MNCCPVAVYQAVTQRELASHGAGTQTLTHHYTWLNTNTDSIDKDRMTAANIMD